MYTLHYCRLQHKLEAFVKFNETMRKYTQWQFSSRQIILHNQCPYNHTALFRLFEIKRRARSNLQAEKKCEHKKMLRTLSQIDFHNVIIRLLGFFVRSALLNYLRVLPAWILSYANYIDD